MERKIEEAGVQAIVGATLTGVKFENRRVQYIELATRYGAVRVQAKGYVDSSGDASLCYEAGLEVREPDAPVYGSLNFLIEGYDLDDRREPGHRTRCASAWRRRATNTAWSGTTAG